MTAPQRRPSLHESWCPAEAHVECCGDSECECLGGVIRGRIEAVTWANEEWSEEYRQGYDKALTRVWAALGESRSPSRKGSSRASGTECQPSLNVTNTTTPEGDVA